MRKPPTLLIALIVVLLGFPFAAFAAAPLVTTQAATNITTNSATLNGNLGNGGGPDVSNLSFQYGLDTNY